MSPVRIQLQGALLGLWGVPDDRLIVCAFGDLHRLQLVCADCRPYLRPRAARACLRWSGVTEPSVAAPSLPLNLRLLREDLGVAARANVSENTAPSNQSMVWPNL
jgi:hypothetical protein